MAASPPCQPAGQTDLHSRQTLHVVAYSPSVLMKTVLAMLSARALSERVSICASRSIYLGKLVKRHPLGVIGAAGLM